MFSLDSGLRYWLYNDPTDMRKSFYTLGGLVNNRMGADCRNGDVYVFLNKRRNRIKLLRYENGGMVLYCKMLDRGTFTVPPSEDTISRSIQWNELHAMVEQIMGDPQIRRTRLKDLKKIWGQP